LDSGGPKEGHIRWGAHWRNLANTTEPSVCGCDAALSQITLTTCWSFLITVYQVSEKKILHIGRFSVSAPLILLTRCLHDAIVAAIGWRDRLPR